MPDAAHLAAALREESLEEVDAGSAQRSRARSKRDPHALLVAQLLPFVQLDEAPANVVAARPAFRDLVVRHPSTYLIGLWAWAWPGRC